MGWGKEWPVNKPIAEASPPNNIKQPWPVEIILPAAPVNQHWPNGALLFKEMSKEEILKQWSDAKLPILYLTTTELREVYNNLKPTHDPYTNPGAMVYYECNCGAILDPKTKSFAALNNAASMAGWKIRFGEVGYTPYCVKCGEGVE